MSISSKVLLVMILLGSLLVGSNVLIQQNVIYPTFTQLERQHAHVSIDRIEELFNQQIKSIDTLVYDWSSWDDSYQFIEDRNRRFIKSNLSSSALSALKINIFYFVNKEGEVIWRGLHGLDWRSPEVETFDQYAKRSLQVLDQEINQLNRSGRAGQKYSRGIFVQDGTPIFYSMRPILTSNGKGPSRGFILMGRVIDQRSIARFQNQIKTQFSIDVVDPSSLDEQTKFGEKYDVTTLDDMRLKIEKLFLVDQVPILKMSMELPREITRKGLDSIVYAVSSLLVIAALTVIIIWLLLRFIVLMPISKLAQEMQNISDSEDYSLRSTVNSQDELGLLSKQFNRIISIVARGQTDLLEANASLEELATIDPLTQIPNRRSMEEKLLTSWQALKREKNPLSILLLDIDYFKLFNDNYGHLAGDQCLRQVARVLSECVTRPNDLVARYGGEEFILILPGNDTSSAQDVAKIVISAIAAEKIEHQHSEIDKFLSVSIGITTVYPSKKSSIESAIKLADKALYNAKRKGRNRFDIVTIENQGANHD